MKFGIAVIRIQGHSMRYIDNLNLLVHEIIILLGVSAIWADVADNYTLSYSSMYDIQNRSTRHLQIMSIPKRHRNKKKKYHCAG